MTPRLRGLPGAGGQIPTAHASGRSVHIGWATQGTTTEVTTSLCFNGNIVRNLDGDSLRDALFGLFYRPQKAAAAAAPAAKKKKAAQKKKKKKKPAERTSLVPDDDEAALASAAAARSAEESHG